MKHLQLGVVFSSFNEKNVRKAAEAVAKKLKAKTYYYESLIPLSTTLKTPQPGREEKRKFNHIVIKKKNKRIMEMFGTPWHASGRVYDENLSNKELITLLKTLAENNIYTFESLKYYHHEVRYLMMLTAFVMVFLAANLVFLTQGIIGKALGLVLSMFGVILMLLYSE